MSKAAKEVVKEFYKLDLLKDGSEVKDFFHPDVELIWNSADGLAIMHFEELSKFFAEIRRTYYDMRVEVSHMLSDDDYVTIRYKYYVKTIENPDEELGIAHFIAIWQVKEGMLYRGYQVSQPVTDNDETTESYHKVKV
ncbi:nuclear transport factor 2 family protein [Ulvibacter antarcticus]|uniref:SnoaL-like protein n=1 Tax=Ulvibacter antarcticus TaxID=442714 RepID=A0A3L9YVV8_9FLAO|nr:nuclear transport factor 2 family protein [Ulvibacter antarcticus]RMA64454.1 SnoaL-like protein [Ulvibacter antarcticus]